MNLELTIGIATYNRADSLKRALLSFLRIKELESLSYEILVAQNNCTDGTSQALNAVQPIFGDKLRFFNEKKQGLSFARNRIVRESQGEIIAYLDDDVTVDENWLMALAKAYRQWPDAACVGGAAELVFEEKCPDWLGEREKKRLSKVDLGNSSREIDDSETLFGLNVSFKKEWFSKVGLFREDLGRKGEELAVGEETDLIQRIRQQAGKIYYEPSMKVFHHVPRERCRRSWFFKRSYWGARSRVRALHSRSGQDDLKKTVARLFRLSREVIFWGLRKGAGSTEFYRAFSNLCGAWGEWVELVSGGKKS